MLLVSYLKLIIQSKVTETLFYVTWSFIALHFIVRSMIHFELIFVKGVRSVSRFFFSFLSSCPAPFLRRLSFDFSKTSYAFVPLSKIS